MNYFVVFFKWLFKEDYGSDDVPSPWVNSDKYCADAMVAPCPTNEASMSTVKEDKAELAIYENGPDVIGAGRSSMPTGFDYDGSERIEDIDKGYKFTDPKGCRLEVYRDKKKDWRWRLLAANNKVVAISGEGYKRKGTMQKSLDLVREIISFVPIEEK